MKILELCLGEGLGGLELYFHKCCVWLHQSDHDLISATVNNSRLSDLANKTELNTFTLPKTGRFPLLTAINLAKRISHHNIDLVHVHHKDDLPLLAWTKLFCKRKFKIVHTRQMQFPRNKKNPYHNFIYNKIDLLITITDQLKATVLKNTNLTADKVKRLYYGVDNNTEVANCNELKSGLGDLFTAGVFSRIEYQKGQHLAIKASAILKNKGIDINLVFVGDVMNKGYHHELLQLIETNGIEETVTFKGFQKNPVSLMKCCDTVIMPSKNETFGLVLIEAMRAGVATIGTNSGGVPEIIDHDKTGLMFEWENEKSLAEQIEKLLNKGFRDIIAQKGKEKADNKFEYGKHFKALEKLLEQTLSNNDSH